LCGGVSSDSGAPDVTLVSPAEGEALAAAEPVTIDVADDVALRRVLLVADNGRGPWEVIHDGTAFAPFYSASSRTVIAGGYRFTCRRDGGWFGAALSVRVFALDTSGNEP